MRKKQEQVIQPTVPVPVFCADPNVGLHSGQVRERERAGYMNTPIVPPTKSVRQIILSNIFTYFNIVFFILAIAIIFVGSWQDLTFMIIVIANTAIGIVQELRSKRVVDKLSLLSEPQANVIRDGTERTIPAEETVRDDIVVFRAGNQIYADAVVVSGDRDACDAAARPEEGRRAGKHRRGARGRGSRYGELPCAGAG